ncbi:MAG: hypothetical protein E6H09_20825 [Bacteroidetes bacterium]|jgi:hypothetical protein|nr:MAG: hypothetical protein E6H09_20825 [Bacteroidota bacterium]
MRWTLIIVIVVFFISCKQMTSDEKKHHDLQGNWLIVSPDHKLKNGRQEIIYSKIQDSIIGLTSLKLISLLDKGVFRQMDSVEKTGKWGMSADDVVFIEDGGQGFDNFNAKFTSYEDGLLELTEFVEAEGERIELVWNLKKISGKFSSKLFNDAGNRWRIHPAHPETEAQIKQRLSDMLNYYSDYYSLVTKESSFFVTTRVFLPFKFYQHGMGIKPFDEQSYFARLFFDKVQAGQAWKYLKSMISALRHDFPRRDDYLQEYAAFMQTMADKIKDL